MDGLIQPRAITHHTQTHALVRVDQVGQDLGRRSDRDAALVPQFVETALHAKVCKPVLAVLQHVKTQPFSQHGLVMWRLRTAAPPAMVPSKQLLISMTFLTV